MVATGLIAMLISGLVVADASAGMIVAPKPGAKVDGPTRVEVKVGRGTVVARLNGNRVKRPFLRTDSKRRSLRIGGAESLTPGSNVLVVRRTTHRGRKRDRVSFRVDANGKLAGIAARGEHVARAPLQLGAKGKSARRWCLLSAPRKSRLAESKRCRIVNTSASLTPMLADQAPRAKPSKSGFADGDARRTTFTPDTPGNYRIALASGSGAAATTDVYTVTAAPTVPAVELDVPLWNGYFWDAIQVGNQSYGVSMGPNSGGEYTHLMLQVVVLDRRTLTETSNTTYDCPPAGETIGCDAALAQELTSDLGKLQDDSLVLVQTLDNVGNGSVGTQTMKALSVIGFDASVPFPVKPPGQQLGVFAAVGIPGLRVGEAWTLRADTGADYAEGLSGVLVKDQFNEYRPAPTDYEPLTVRQPGATTQNTMDVAGQPVAASLPSGAEGGFQITVVDGTTGRVEESQVAVTNPASASTVNQALTAIEGSMNDGDIGSVLVASLGSPAEEATQISGDWNALAAFIQQHGGTKHAIHAMKPGDTYAMAGRQSSGPVGGIEVGPSIDPAGASPDPDAKGGLVGALTRNDDDWRLEPSVSQVVDPSIDMQRALYQDTTPWPGFDAAAMTYIANAVQLAPDVRQAYWTQPYDGAEWGQKQQAIKDLAYPTGSPGFSEDAFTALQGELVTEISWLINAQSYLDSLAGPFSDQGLANWQEVETIANEIGNGVVQAPNAPISTPWPQIVDDLLSVAAVVDPEVSIVQKSWKAAADIASALSSGSSTGEDTFQSTAADFGTDLVARLTAIESSYGRMLDIVAADYGKLKTFGTLAGCSPGSSPQCTPGWQWTQDMQTEASLGLQLWSRRQTFQALLPAKIGSLAWFGPFESNYATDADDWTCWSSNTRTPFDDLPNSAQTKIYSSMSGSGPMHDLWAIANWTDYEDGEPTLPKASLTDPLFAPPDPGGNPNTGGLGLVPAHFYLQYLSSPRDIEQAEDEASRNDNDPDHECKFEN